MNDMKFTTAGDYMNDIRNNTEGKIAGKCREIGRVMVDYTSELLFPRNMAKYIRSNNAFTNDEILDLLEAIDAKYIERFGENPYERLMNVSRSNTGRDLS